MLIKLAPISIEMDPFAMNFDSMLHIPGSFFENTPQRLQLLNPIKTFVVMFEESFKLKIPNEWGMNGGNGETWGDYGETPVFLPRGP